MIMDHGVGAITVAVHAAMQTPCVALQAAAAAPPIPVIIAHHPGGPDTPNVSPAAV